MDGFDISRSGPSPKAKPDNRRHRESGRNPVFSLWRAIGGDWVAGQLSERIERATQEGSTQLDSVAETKLIRKMLSFPEVEQALPPGSITIQGPKGRIPLTVPQLKTKLEEFHS